jgi:CheY-like chemotaxis protein
VEKKGRSLWLGGILTEVDVLNPANLRGKRVLVVDDVQENQVLESHFLIRAGAEVELASNGLEAVEKALHGNHDAILMDLHMPILDGLAAAMRLREKGYTKPIIAVTADAMDSMRDRAFNTGFNEYLLKPVMRVDLICAVRRICNPELPN